MKTTPPFPLKAPETSALDIVCLRRRVVPDGFSAPLLAPLLPLSPHSLSFYSIHPDVLGYGFRNSRGFADAWKNAVVTSLLLQRQIEA